MKTSMRTLIVAAATLGLGSACHGQAEASIPDSVKGKLAGIWEVQPRGPGRGGPPPGARSGGNSGDLGRFSPPPGGPEGQSGRFGPPPGGPEDSADDLPGPNVEGLDRGDKMTYAIMTPKGRAVFEAMNPHDLPSNNCKSNGLPSLVGIPDLQQWSFAGDVLTIKYADFDTVRTIYLDGRADDAPPSLYGHSVGSFADGELTVTTDRLIATPGGLGRNAPGSASRSYIERYRLSADGTRVTGYLTVHDPEYLTRDLTLPIAFSRATDVTEIADVPCSVESSQRYLDG
jgi:hypothetical protein